MVMTMMTTTTMRLSSLPIVSILLALLAFAFASHNLLPRYLFVRADAFEDLWNQYMQQSKSQDSKQQQYESIVSRRERNLDHWDVPTAAAYLGLHPETLQPLPKYYSSKSSSSYSTTTTTTTTTSSSSSMSSEDLADEYIGIDAAILFYAQWDRNSHAVAPTWDAIATHLQAGSISSNLIMALFDCEKTSKHIQLCTAAGIQAYPTMMYVGSGTFHDTDWFTRAILGKDKSAGPFGATTLRRTVKFQGNWQYGDQILDWINIMRGLSSWNNIAENGPLRGLRNVLFRFLTGGRIVDRSSLKQRGTDGRSSGSLPVGIPPHFQSELRGGAGGGGGADSVTSLDSAKRVKKLEKELNSTIKEKELYELAATHSNLLLDKILLSTNKYNSTVSQEHKDPFTILTNSDGWYRNATTFHERMENGTLQINNDEHPLILRSCVLELVIDYCTRLTTRATKIYLDVLNAIPEQDPFPTLDEIEKYLLDDVKSQEPYCGLIENCMTTNFENEEDCRPKLCPFESAVACSYVESCLEPDIQNEYAVALGLIEKGETVMDKVWDRDNGDSEMDKSSTASSSSGTKTGSKNGGSNVGGWGIPTDLT